MKLTHLQRYARNTFVPSTTDEELGTPIAQYLIQQKAQKLWQNFQTLPIDSCENWLDAAAEWIGPMLERSLPYDISQNSNTEDIIEEALNGEDQQVLRDAIRVYALDGGQVPEDCAVSGLTTEEKLWIDKLDRERSFYKLPTALLAALQPEQKQ